jgi:hypothetical protein
MSNLEKRVLRLKNQEKADDLELPEAEGMGEVELKDEEFDPKETAEEITDRENKRELAKAAIIREIRKTWRSNTFEELDALVDQHMAELHGYDTRPLLEVDAAMMDMEADEIKAAVTGADSVPDYLSKRQEMEIQSDPKKLTEKQKREETERAESEKRVNALYRKKSDEKFAHLDAVSSKGKLMDDKDIDNFLKAA